MYIEYMCMQRTQILLDPQLKRTLDRVSQGAHTSVSRLIREAVAAHLMRLDRVRVGGSGLRALKDIAGRDRGLKDISRRVDEMLYHV